MRSFLIVYSSDSGTLGTPMTKPFAFDRKAFQKTAMPYAASMRSSSSFSALTSTVRQNRSTAAGLLLFSKPVQHRHSLGELWPAGGCEDAEHCSGDSAFIAPIQELKLGERCSEMKRCGQPPGLDWRAAAMRSAK